MQLSYKAKIAQIPFLNLKLNFYKKAGKGHSKVFRKGILLKQMLPSYWILCPTLYYLVAANNENKRKCTMSLFHNWRKLTPENKAISKVLQHCLWTTLKFLSWGYESVKLWKKDSMRTSDCKLKEHEEIQVRTSQ